MSKGKKEKNGSLPEEMEDDLVPKDDRTIDDSVIIPQEPPTTEGRSKFLRIFLGFAIAVISAGFALYNSEHVEIDEVTKVYVNESASFKANLRRGIKWIPLMQKETQSKNWSWSITEKKNDADKISKLHHHILDTSISKPGIFYLKAIHSDEVHKIEVDVVYRDPVINGVLYRDASYVDGQKIIVNGRRVVIDIDSKDVYHVKFIGPDQNYGVEITYQKSRVFPKIILLDQAVTSTDLIIVGYNKDKSSSTEFMIRFELEDSGRPSGGSGTVCEISTQDFAQQLTRYANSSSSSRLNSIKKNLDRFIQSRNIKLGTSSLNDFYLDIQALHPENEPKNYTIQVQSLTYKDCKINSVIGFTILNSSDNDS